MSKLLIQFEDFINSLEIEKLSLYEKKLINIIHENFDEISSRGTGGGLRAKYLNSLILKKHNIVSDQISIIKNSAIPATSSIKKLYSLKIQNFRGFSDKEENFDLNKDYILVYGPNGAGKSSFCEALEYLMLGYIKEAEVKRIPLQKYIVNKLSNKSEKPILKGVYKEGEGEGGKVFGANPLYYGFCFIEKNRIEKFARISSSTQSDKTEIIATLFDIDDFNNFVHNFTDNFETYIDISGKYSEEFKTKEIKIAGSQQNIDQFKKQIESIKTEKISILKEFIAGIEINDDNIEDEYIKMGVYVNGDGEKKGRIDELNDLLIHKKTESKIEINNNQELSEIKEKIEKEVLEYRRLLSEYEKNKEEMKFKDLYNAVLAVEEYSKELCPVCKTKIKGGILSFRKTKVHPYKNAKQSIELLKSVSELEKSLKVIETVLKKDIKDFAQKIKSKIEWQKNRLSIIIPDSLIDIEKLDEETIKNIEILIKEFVLNITEFEKIDYDVKQKNEDFVKIASEGDLLIKEKDKLSVLSDQIKSINTRNKTLFDNLTIAENSVREFKAKNHDLIEKVRQEKGQIEINKEYLKAYQSFKKRLESYKQQLPIKIVGNLNDLVKEIYNIINSGDEKFELIESIQLPILPNDYIKIYFQDDPRIEYDALHILSEGHIKCLGLSILLAKAIYNGCNILIFDDIVNAIDDAHRRGVRELISGNDLFSQKQIIFTCHGEEFIKDLENMLPKNDYFCYFFLPPKTRILEIKKDLTNYLADIEINIRNNKKRSALSSCRRALENLSDQLWNKLAKTYQISLSLKFRSPHQQDPELMNKVQQLRNQAEKIGNIGLSEIVNILKYFEGIEVKNKIVWDYLNKGTHNETDRKEFDIEIVKEINKNLISLFDQIKKIKRVDIKISEVVSQEKLKEKLKGSGTIIS